MRKQRVFLALAELAVLAGEPAYSLLRTLSKASPKWRSDVELVEQNLCLRSVVRLEGRVLKGLPQVHHRQPNPLALLLSQPLVEHVHTLFRMILAPKLNGSLARTKSLTTIRWLCPFLMAISSMPMTFGPGVPTLRNCSCMYCLSNSLTALQSR